MPSVVLSRSYGSVRVFWLDREKALRRVREAASRLLRERPEVLGVYLFGSLAEGRAVPGSDADLLILLRRSERRFLDRPLEYLPAFDEVGLPVDLFCYTPEEAERVPLAGRARQTAIPLAERSASAPATRPETAAGPPSRA